MSRSPSPPVLERQCSPSPRVLLRQLPLPRFALGQLVEGSFGDRSKENVCPSAHHLVTPKDTSPLEDRGPDKKKTRTLEEGAIGRTPTSGAEGGGRSEETPTRMLGIGRRILVPFTYKTANDARAMPLVGRFPPPLKERQLLVGRGSERPKSNVSNYLHHSVFSFILI